MNQRHTPRSMIWAAWIQAGAAAVAAVATVCIATIANRELVIPQYEFSLNCAERVVEIQSLGSDSNRRPAPKSIDVVVFGVDSQGFLTKWVDDTFDTHLVSPENLGYKVNFASNEIPMDANISIIELKYRIRNRSYEVVRKCE